MHEQAEFTLSLRPLLNALCHNDGQDGPGDADEPAAAAVLHTAAAYLFGTDLASTVSGRAVEAVDERLNTEDGHADDPDEVLTVELRRQLHDLDLIGRYSGALRHASLGLDIETSSQLHRFLRIPLSSI